MKNVLKQIVWALLAILPFVWVSAGDLETARTALQDRLYPIAQSHAEKVLRNSASEPVESVAALLLVLEAQSLQGKYEEMLITLEVHDAVVRLAPIPETFLYWRALALLKAGHFADAVRIAETEERAASSTYVDALLRIDARAKLALGDQAGALGLFARIDKSTTNVLTRADNALEWALVLDHAEHSAEALDVLKIQNSLSLQSASLNEGTLLRGRILMRQGKPTEAATIFNQLAMNEHAVESARIQALLEMSVYTFNSGKTNEAVACARSAYGLAKQPETRRLAGFRLGDLLASDTSTIEESERLVKSLVREFPEGADSMRAQLKLADSLLQAKRPERAASEYQIFLETYPSSALDSQVLQGRGWALFKLGRFTEANGVFQRAAELSTQAEERVECTFKQGDALLADGRYADAAHVYGKLGADAPNSSFGDRALFQSADCLERAGLRAEAIAQYRKVAATYPKREVASRALLRLAALQEEANECDQAVLTYTSLLTASNSKDVRVDAKMGRGKVHYRMYRFDAAMQDFASVAENDPKRRDEARFLLVLCLYGLGRDKEARAAGASFLLDFPESTRLPDMMLWLGKFDFNRGKFSDARRFFLEYVTRWPGNVWADAALFWAARAAFGAADFTATVELVTRLVHEYSQSTRRLEARLVQTDALMELARFDEAVLLLDQIISQAQGGEWNTAALLRKGDCLFALGANNEIRYREALYAYRELLIMDNLTPTLTLQLHYKVGRCLEKLKRIDDAIDEYYSEVMIRYQNERAHGVWQDETNTSLYVRAAFNTAELYEQKNQPEQAIRVLQRVIQVGVSGEEEAQQRIERLRKKKL